MGFASTYLQKHQLQKFTIKEAPLGLLCSIVIIPAYLEPDLLKTLESIDKCHLPDGITEVFVLFNYPENAHEAVIEQTLLDYEKSSAWCAQHTSDKIRYYSILSDPLPQKFAGVGLARKLLMDLAVERFNEIDKPEGLIFSLDADTLVPADYFKVPEQLLYSNPALKSVVFNFEHAVSGNVFPQEVYEASALYELHLRYLRQQLKATGHPYYEYTIGSCFAVKASVYTRIGGMNKRKAGEDFYFLQKVFAQGDCAFLPKTCLKPSPRPSDRVPFGTGMAVRKIIAGPNPGYISYHPDSFAALKRLFSLIPLFYKANTFGIEALIQQLPSSMLEFLRINEIQLNLEQIRKNTASFISFEKRFYDWFDAFRVIKYLNFARIADKNETDIREATAIAYGKKYPADARELLEFLREIDLNDAAV